MDDIYIRPHAARSFALYRDDTLLVYGIDSEDAKELRRLYSQSGVKKQGAFSTELSHDASSVAARRSTASRSGVSFVGKRGRKLILEDHVGTIRSMVAENPGTTKRDVEQRLRRSGVNFSSNTAITNLARTYDIKLRA